MPCPNDPRGPHPLGSNPGVSHRSNPRVPHPTSPGVSHPTNPGVSYPSNPGVPAPKDPRVPHPGVPHPQDAKVPHSGDPGVPHPSNPGVPAPGDAGVPHPGLSGLPGAVDVPIGPAQGCRVDHQIPPAPARGCCTAPHASTHGRVPRCQPRISPRTAHGEEGVRDPGQRQAAWLGCAPRRPRGWRGSGGARMAAAPAAAQGFGELAGDQRREGARSPSGDTAQSGDKLGVPERWLRPAWPWRGHGAPCGQHSRAVPDPAGPCTRSPCWGLSAFIICSWLIP